MNSCLVSGMVSTYAMAIFQQCLLVLLTISTQLDPTHFQPSILLNSVLPFSARLASILSKTSVLFIIYPYKTLQTFSSIQKKDISNSTAGIRWFPLHVS